MESCAEEVYRLLDECDSAFFDCEEDLSALSYAYITENIDSFS